MFEIIISQDTLSRFKAGSGRKSVYTKKLRRVYLSLVTTSFQSLAGRLSAGVVVDDVAVVETGMDIVRIVPFWMPLVSTFSDRDLSQACRSLKSGLEHQIKTKIII